MAKFFAIVLAIFGLACALIPPVLLFAMPVETVKHSTVVGLFGLEVLGWGLFFVSMYVLRYWED